MDLGRERSSDWPFPSGHLTNRNERQEMNHVKRLSTTPKRRRFIKWEVKKKIIDVFGVTATYGTLAPLVSILSPKMKGWKWRVALRLPPKPNESSCWNSQLLAKSYERRNNREKEEIGQHSPTWHCKKLWRCALLKENHNKEKQEVVELWTNFWWFGFIKRKRKVNPNLKSGRSWDPE